MAERLGDAEKRYYGRIMDLLNDRGEEEEEEPDGAFTENVLRQIQADGVTRVLCDKDGSRAVERLLQVCEMDAAFLGELLRPVADDFRHVARDRCGSHSVEALLKTLGKQLNSGGANSGTTETDLETPAIRLFEDLQSDLGELLIHPYASHVVCTAMQVLSGVYVAERLTRSRYSREFRKAKLEEEERQNSQTVGGAVVERQVSVPQTFTTALKGLSRSTCKLENFSSLLVDPQASPVLQVLLRVLVERLPKRGKKLIQKVVLGIREALTSSDEEEEEDNRLSEVFTSSVGSHLVGVLLELASPDLHQWLWETCFEGKLLSFAVHPIANYPLQQFIFIAATPQADLILTELLPHLEDILFAGHSGVVVKMAEVALRLPDQQPEFMKMLLTAFHTENDTNYCVPLFLTLTAYEVYLEHAKQRESDKDVERRSVQVQGSLLVQALLKHNNPRVIVKSLLAMETEDIIWLSCDAAGSHAVDAFFASPCVKSPKKKRLVTKLKANLVALCKDKHGSRVMDAIWRNSDVSTKEGVAKQLMIHETELADDFYGRIVLRNCNVSHYRRKQSVVEEDGISRGTATKNLFSDILQDTRPATDMAPSSTERKRKSNTRNNFEVTRKRMKT